MSSKFKTRFLLISISLLLSIVISLIFVSISGTNNEFNYYEFLLIVILSLIIIYIFGVIYTRFFLYNKLKDISKDILPSKDISQTVTTNMDDLMDEIKDYDFENPGFNGATGHFTQVVWKESVKLGCGYSGSYITCRYCPAGNMMGAFP